MKKCYLTSAVFRRAVRTYARFEKKINEIIVICPSLSFDEIAEQAIKQYNTTCKPMHIILDDFYFLASRGNAVPWNDEEDRQIKIKPWYE